MQNITKLGVLGVQKLWKRNYFSKKILMKHKYIPGTFITLRCNNNTNNNNNWLRWACHLQ